MSYPAFRRSIPQLARDLPMNDEKAVPLRITVIDIV
jgi:hypothetical protein